MTADGTLVVAEVFGPTVQGEGPSCGRRASFLRLGGCNLTCSWCDTPYTWDGSRYDLRAELTRRPVDEVCAELAAHGTRLLVVTGGEPLLHQQQPGWAQLLHTAAAYGWEVEVETNGTIPPTATTRDLVDRLNVSPKLPHAGMTGSRRINAPALAALADHPGATLKVVVRDREDVTRACWLADEHGWPRHRVWVMPEGTTAAAVLDGARQVADAAIRAGLNLTPRLHTLLWDDERSR